jgi:hypothetical protein
VVAQGNRSWSIRSHRVSFRIGAPLADASLLVHAPQPLVAGAEAEIEVIGRAPNQSPYPVMQCPAGASGPEGCVPVGTPHLLVATGTRGAIVPVDRITAGDATIDCGEPGACVVRVIDPGGAIAAEAAITVRVAGG